jgi:glycosyltransferase involved in cell wall biosynthesis
MSVKNREKYVKEAIESILDQTLQVEKFIIIDDGSTDNSFEVINSSVNEKCVVYRNEKSLGISTNYNRMLSELSDFDYVCIQDSDDISHPNRFYEQVKYLKNNIKIDFCFSLAESLENKRLLGEFLCPNELPIRRPWIITPTAMFRMSKLKNLVSYATDFKRSEDYSMIYNLAWKHKINFSIIPKVLYSYRIHENQEGTQQNNQFLFYLLAFLKYQGENISEYLYKETNLQSDKEEMSKELILDIHQKFSKKYPSLTYIVSEWVFTQRRKKLNFKIKFEISFQIKFKLILDKILSKIKTRMAMLLNSYK